MPFIGNAPSNNFVSLKRQDITGDGTASYTLDYKVASVNDVLIYVNHVKQDPASYSISGTSLTMGGTVSSSDDFYIIYLGQGLQTVTPADNTITTAMLQDDAVTPSKQSSLANPFASQLLHIRDEKSAGTSGGSSVADTDNIRDLNTILTNEITGASLSSNQITLPAGTFYINAKAHAYATRQHRLLLQNVTDSSVTLLAMQSYNNITYLGHTASFLQGRFTISAQKTFELRHYTRDARASDGLGVSVGSVDSRTDVFADVQIWKVA